MVLWAVSDKGLVDARVRRGGLTASMKQGQSALDQLSLVRSMDTSWDWSGMFHSVRIAAWSEKCEWVRDESVLQTVAHS